MQSDELSLSGVLEELLDEVGFEFAEVRSVPPPFTFADREDSRRAVLGTGSGQGVLRLGGDEIVREALTAAGEEFVRADGSYRFDDAFRVVGATPRGD